ncbi:hypothetical protein H5410_022932, partial [Solanum commersonii]
FLSISTSYPEVSLICCQCNEINLTDLQLHHGVVLNVNCTWRNGECPTFLDALLWSCHPRRLNIRSTSATFKCFIYRLINMKNSRAQVYIFDVNRSQSWQRVELNREERPHMPYFLLLDW